MKQYNKVSDYILLKPSKASIIYKQRLSEIDRTKKALEKYYENHSKYPLSSGFDGVCTKWGKSEPDYIKGLSPEYIKKLPIDPRMNKRCGAGYLYKSNGKDFKFIVHTAPKYDLNHINNDMIDPIRKTWAYGIWTDGAKNW